MFRIGVSSIDNSKMTTLMDSLQGLRRRGQLSRMLLEDCSALVWDRPRMERRS